MKRLLVALLFVYSGAFAQSIDSVETTATPNEGRVIWNANDYLIVDSLAAHQTQIGILSDTANAHATQIAAAGTPYTAQQVFDSAGSISDTIDGAWTFAAAARFEEALTAEDTTYLGVLVLDNRTAATGGGRIDVNGHGGTPILFTWRTGGTYASKTAISSDDDIFNITNHAKLTNTDGAAVSRLMFLGGTLDVDSIDVKFQVDVMNSAGSYDTLTFWEDTLAAAYFKGDGGSVTGLGAANMADGSVSDAEFRWLDGVDAAVMDKGDSALYATQTDVAGFLTGSDTTSLSDRINLKAPIEDPTFTGTLTAPTGLNGTARLSSGVLSGTPSDTIGLAAALAAASVIITADAIIDSLNTVEPVLITKRWNFADSISINILVAADGEDRWIAVQDSMNSAGTGYIEADALTYLMEVGDFPDTAGIADGWELTYDGEGGFEWTVDAGGAAGDSSWMSVTTDTLMAVGGDTIHVVDTLISHGEGMIYADGIAGVGTFVENMAADNDLLVQHGLDTVKGMVAGTGVTFTAGDGTDPDTLNAASGTVTGDAIEDSLNNAARTITLTWDMDSLHTAKGVTVAGGVTVTGDVAAATFTGDGSALTSLEAPDMADGSVSDAEFQRLDGLSEDISTTFATFALITDTTAVRTYSNSIYALITDTTAVRTYSNSIYALITDTTAVRTYSSSIYAPKADPTFTGVVAADTIIVTDSLYAAKVTSGEFAGNGNKLTSLTAPNMADGSISDAEFQYLDGVSEDIPTTFATFALITDTTAIRTYSNSIYALITDTTAVRTYSNSLYLQSVGGDALWPETTSVAATWQFTYDGDGTYSWTANGSGAAMTGNAIEDSLNNAARRVTQSWNMDALQAVITDSGGQVWNALAAGLIADGATDNTAALQALIDAQADASSGVTIYFPEGHYEFASEVLIDHSRVNLIGAGSNLSFLEFDPDGADEIFLHYNSGSLLYECRLENLGIWTADSDFVATLVEIVDASSFYAMNLQLAAYDTVDTASIGLRLRGRELQGFTNIRISAPRPIVISDNPNSTIDIDHYNFHNFTMTALSSDYPCVFIEDSVNLTDIAFDGYQAWGASTYGLLWIDSTGSEASTGLTLRNIGTEVIGNYSVYVDHNATYKLHTLDIDNCNFTSGGGANGIYIRNVSRMTVKGGRIGGEAVNADDTDSQIAFLGVYWLASHTFSMSGLGSSFAVPVTNVAYLPETGFYNNFGASWKHDMARLGTLTADSIATANGVTIGGDLDVTGTTTLATGLTGRPYLTSGALTVEASDTTGMGAANAALFALITDTTAVRTYSNSIYALITDTTAVRTYSSSIYALITDTTAVRTYSNSIYLTEVSDDALWPDTTGITDGWQFTYDGEGGYEWTADAGGTAMTGDAIEDSLNNAARRMTQAWNMDALQAAITDSGGQVWNVSIFATGGTGTTGDPWTGWDTNTPWANYQHYYMPDGYYDFSDTLKLGYQGIYFEGESPTGTILRHTGTGMALTFDKTPTDGIHAIVENFTVEGNANTTHGIYVEAFGKSEFNNIYFRDVDTCLMVTNGVMLTFNNMHSSEAGAAWVNRPDVGVVVRNGYTEAVGLTTTEFNQCYFNGMASHGFYFVNGTYITINGGGAEVCGGYGVYLEDGADWITMNHVDMENDTLGGFYISAGSAWNYIEVSNFTGFECETYGDKSMFVNCNFDSLEIYNGGERNMFRGGNATIFTESDVDQYYDNFSANGAYKNNRIRELLETWTTGTGSLTGINLFNTSHHGSAALGGLLQYGGSYATNDVFNDAVGGPQTVLYGGYINQLKIGTVSDSSIEFHQNSTLAGQIDTDGDWVLTNNVDVGGDLDVTGTTTLNTSLTGRPYLTAGVLSVEASDTTGMGAANAALFALITDTTAVRTYSNSIYALITDTTAVRTYSNSIYALITDTTAVRTYSNSIYKAKATVSAWFSSGVIDSLATSDTLFIGRIEPGGTVDSILVDALGAVDVSWRLEMVDSINESGGVTLVDAMDVDNARAVETTITAATLTQGELLRAVFTDVTTEPKLFVISVYAH